MNRDDFKHTLRTLAQVERDLARLGKSTRKLAEGLGQDLGGVFDAAVQRRLEEVDRLLAPLADVLRVGPRATASRTTRRPRPEPRSRAGARPRGGARGGRGRKVNLTADQIQQALERARGVKARAAELLGVSLPTFDRHVRGR